MTRRICPAEEDIGNGIALLFTGIPLYENGRNVGFLPLQSEGLSRDKNKHNGFACGVNGAYQIALCSGKREVGEIESFTAVGTTVVACQRRTGTTAKHYCHIARLGSSHCLGNVCRVGRHKVAATGVAHLHSVLLSHTAYR